MAKVISFEQVNQSAAAIDIGAEKVFVSTDGTSVQTYGTFTGDYRKLAEDLLAAKIESVCMEATGVYWISLYQMLEEAGLDVCLVNPKEVKQVKGRKSDPNDCRWIQRVFSAGLVRQSYVPKGKLRELRMLVREREDIIEMGSCYVNKMGKQLELMNIKLKSTLSQLHGVSGLKMIEAIIAGERNPAVLLSLCSPSIIKSKSEDVLKALEGNYNDTYIFMLNANLQMWKRHQEQLMIIDEKLEEVLATLEEGKDQVQAVVPAKPIRHHRPQIKNFHQKMLNIYGVDGNTISGISDYTLLKLLGEVGADMSRFPTVKHFVSWCQLAPVSAKSGKMNRRMRIRAGSRAGQIFREVAQGLLNSKYIAIGSFMRRLRAKKDSKIAVKAGARKLAQAFYNLLTKGSAYVEQGVEKYEQQIRQREQAFLTKLAKKHGMQLAPLKT
jgi:transposase